MFYLSGKIKDINYVMRKMSLDTCSVFVKMWAFFYNFKLYIDRFLIKSIFLNDLALAACAFIIFYSKTYLKKGFVNVKPLNINLYIRWISSRLSVCQLGSLLFDTIHILVWDYSQND